MPELRRDPVVGYWTIISTERSRRPVEFIQRHIVEERRCPFCEGRESEAAQEIYAVRAALTKPNTPGWQVRVVQSMHALLDPKITFDRYGQGLYDVMEGIGSHELIIESPKHLISIDELKPEDLEKVLHVYAQRINALEKDPRYKYALLFKNQGLISGSASDIIRHTRSQLIAMPITPMRVKEELEAAKLYFERHERCVFCDIVRQEERSNERLVFQNKAFYAFCPFAGRMPFEIWLLPRKHCPDFGRLEPADFKDLAEALKECLSRVRRLLNDPPLNLILHTAPFRHKKKGLYWRTLDEDYHWYFQLSPRLTHDAGFEWGTGIYINPTPPEDAAQMLREAL